jgi:hypothetical protein
MAKFDSTPLPQTNDPKEIHKMGLDLLDKINKVQAAIPTPANLSGLCPLPQGAAGVGQVVSVQSADGGALNLPAGGTWWYFNVHALDHATFVFSKATAAIAQSGIAAGGTQIVAGSAGFFMALDCIQLTI